MDAECILVTNRFNPLMISRVSKFHIKPGPTILCKRWFLQGKLNRVIFNFQRGSASNTRKYTYQFVIIICPSWSIKRLSTDYMTSCLQTLKTETQALQWDGVVGRSVTQYGSCKMCSHTLQLFCQIFEYDTCWHLVRHKHKLLSPHTNVKHPSSWIHARAPAESRINDASLPSPVTTNLRSWVLSVICNATLPPWGVFQVVAAGLGCATGALQLQMKFVLQ